MSEPEILAGKEPFLWEGGSREVVLCIHGFTGAPGMFRRLGRLLLKDELTVYAPRLPGHATAPEDLAEVTVEQYLQTAEQAYEHLANAYERVHIVGLSLGGALATLLAANHAGEEKLGSVSLLSPGYGTNKVLAARLGLSAGMDPSTIGDRMIPLPQRKPQNDEMDECLFGYNAVPLKAFVRIQGMNGAVQAARSGVTAPVLLLYSGIDAVVDAAVCAESVGLFPHLEEAHCFNESEHNLLMGCDREETMARCTAFIRGHRL